MDYNKIYNNIIERAKQRQIKNPLNGYKEIHHVIPRSIGGSNEPINLVELTLKEHFLCHELLVYIYPNNKEVVYALWMMTTTTIASKYNVSNRNKNEQQINISASQYERIKLLYIKFKSQKRYSIQERKNVSDGTKNAMQDIEIRKKCGIKNKGSKWYYNKTTLECYKWYQGDNDIDLNIYNWGRPKISDENKEKISLSQKLKKSSYYEIPNSYNNKTKERIIFIYEYNEYTNVTIPKEWNKIEKKTIKDRSVRKQLYSILSSTKYMNFVNRVLFKLPNTNYVKRYFYVKPELYIILSKYNFKFEDYTNKDKVLNALNKYYNNNQRFS